jgi:hypothetical protein
VHVVVAAIGFAMPRRTREVPRTPARDMAWCGGGGGTGQKGRGEDGKNEALNADEETEGITGREQVGP